MLWLLLFIAAMIWCIYYVFKLDFELGSGFTEIRKYIREAEYTVIRRGPKEEDTKKPLLTNHSEQDK